MRTQALVLLLAMTLPFGGVATAEEMPIDRAADAYSIQNYAEALRLYEALARQGDPVAAEMAGQMLYFGESLYGEQVVRDMARAGLWLRQAAQAGRPVALHLLRTVDRAQYEQVRSVRATSR